MNVDNLQIRSEQRVGLKVRNLTISVSTQTKKKSFFSFKKQAHDKDIESVHTNKILDNVSFDLAEGEILAIMGGSGSGKTTLLNTLSQRININNHGLEFGGSIQFTNQIVPNLKSVQSAYLLQTDIFLPGLTVFETLKYQADLRLSTTHSKDEKLKLVNELIEILGLSSAREEKITSFKDINKTTLSGGEQRRVSLAIQLLTKPSILFLDEPTTGLDSSNAYSLVKNLKLLTTFGMTIVLSIHQPRIEILDLFDKTCLLTRGGKLIYYGGLANALEYFESVGFRPPPNQTNRNIFDYLMDLSIKDSRSLSTEKSTTQRINELVENWKLKSNESLIPTEFEGPVDTKSQFVRNVKLFKKSDNRLPLYREIMILTKRTFILSYRDTHSLYGLNGGSIILGIVLGWMFYKPHPDLAGIRSITSSLYVILEVVGFSPLIFELDRLWAVDGKFFFRERSENLISIPGFLISRRLAKFWLEDVPVPLFFTVISYFMWGLRGEATNFFIFLAVAIMVNMIGMASAMFCFAVSRDFPFSGMIMNIYYQLQNCACGYFVNAKTMPVYVRWTKYLAYFWYAFGALTSNQFTDWVGDCDPSVFDCTEFSGNYTLQSLGYPRNWVKEPICILLGWYFGLYILAGIAFHYRNYDIVMAKSKTNTIGGDEELEVDIALTSKENPYVDNHCIDVNLSCINLNILGGSEDGSDLVLLNEVNASFKGRNMNAIMGPSGSGKSTLLNLLTGRLSKSDSFNVSGSISLNQIEVTQPEFATICSYVVQDDSVLLPTLTVRETLYFQARLRLDESLHINIANIVNDLIRRMGLIECADILIGSENVKGISGGEKRRVSIAIQLLNNPKVLLLDEPTSGLDSFTATSIIELLHKLADDGTTIILTIHQPKSELLEHFSNVLLLAKGGYATYNGSPQSMREYFSNIGYPCPELTNLADYILDIISNSLEEDPYVAEARVHEFISRWRNSDEAQNINELIYQQSNKESDKIAYKKELLSFARKPVSFKVALKAVCKRQMLNIMRSEDTIFARGIQLILLGGALAIYFAPLSRANGSAAISNRLGLIQEVLNLYYIGYINNITVYPIERNIFYQEYADGTYGVLVFSLSYLINELPTEIVPTLVFSVLIVFGIGLPRTAGMFFTMFYACFVSVNCGESLGIMTNTVFSHLGLATNVLSSLMLTAVFMGGTMSLNMPKFFKAFNWINPMKYAVGVTSSLGFQGQIFECDLEESSCLLDSGEAVLTYYHLRINYTVFMIALSLCLVIYRLIAISILYARMRYFH